MKPAEDPTEDSAEPKGVRGDVPDVIASQSEQNKVYTISGLFSTALTLSFRRMMILNPHAIRFQHQQRPNRPNHVSANHIAFLEKDP